MISYYKYLFVLIFSFGCCLSLSANDANNLLDNAANKFQQAKSLSADFSISGNGNMSTGKIILSGDRFNMTMPGLSIWYDGRTQWTYTHSTNEVSVTEPTPDELQQVNPFAIINAFRRVYSASIVSQNNQTATIRLTPLASHGEAITQVLLTIDKSTLYPSVIKLALDNNELITITINDISVGQSLPAAGFTFSEKDYPEAEIIDLR